MNVHGSAPETASNPEAHYLEIANQLIREIRWALYDSRKQQHTYVDVGTYHFDRELGSCRGLTEGTIVNIEGVPVKVEEIAYTSSDDHDSSRRAYRISTRKPLSRSAPANSGFDILIFTKPNYLDPDYPKATAYEASYTRPGAPAQSPELLASTAFKFRKINS